MDCSEVSKPKSSSGWSWSSAKRRVEIKLAKKIKKNKREAFCRTKF